MILERLWNVGILPGTRKTYQTEFDRFCKMFEKCPEIWPKPMPFRPMDLMFSVRLADSYPLEYSTAASALSADRYMLREFNFDVEKNRPGQRAIRMPVLNRMSQGYRRLKPKKVDVRIAFMVTGLSHPPWEKLEAGERYVYSTMVIIFHGAFRPEVLTRWKPVHSRIMLKTGGFIELVETDWYGFMSFFKDPRRRASFSGIMITIRTKGRDPGEIFLPYLPGLKDTAYWWFCPCVMLACVLSTRTELPAWGDSLMIRQDAITERSLIHCMRQWSHLSGKVTRYSFRSGWRSAATLAGVPETVSDLVGRWKPTNIGSVYTRMSKCQLVGIVAKHWTDFFLRKHSDIQSFVGGESQYLV